MKDFYYIKTNKNEKSNPQNNTFANPNTQAKATACKRIVFLPTHPIVTH